MNLRAATIVLQEERRCHDEGVSCLAFSALFFLPISDFQLISFQLTNPRTTTSTIKPFEACLRLALQRREVNKGPLSASQTDIGSRKMHEIAYFWRKASDESGGFLLLSCIVVLSSAPRCRWSCHFFESSSSPFHMKKYTRGRALMRHNIRSSAKKEIRGWSRNQRTRQY